MKVSSAAKRLARRLFRVCTADGRLAPDRLRAASGIIAARPSRVDTAALKELTRLVRLEVASRHAVVETASPLSPETAEALRGDLLGRYGADLTSEFRVDPALIGGMRVRVGSDLWDGSVAGHLDRLRAGFEENH
jgi:F-type H+-transporting ATPase subunit delta